MENMGIFVKNNKRFFINNALTNKLEYGTLLIESLIGNAFFIVFKSIN